MSESSIDFTESTELLRGKLSRPISAKLEPVETPDISKGKNLGGWTLLRGVKLTPEGVG